MKVSLDEEYAAALNQKIAAYIESTKRDPDEFFHVSDLINPRWKFFSDKYGYTITSSDVGSWIPGIAFHELLQKILGQEFAEKKLYLDDDIIGHADWANGEIIEIKTSRKWTVPELPEEHYVDQNGCYMAMEDVPTGRIVVIYFTAGRTWNGGKPSKLEIKCWKVEADDEERELIRTQMRDMRDLIVKCIKADDHTELPLCLPFKCFGEYKGKLSNVCPYIKECQPGEGRYEKYLKHEEKS